MIEGRLALPLRIVVVAPPTGVPTVMQKGKDTHVLPVRDGADLAFDFEVTVDGAVATGAPRLLGPFVHGPPTARFAYITSGHPWRRRAKVPLFGIEWAMIEAWKTGERVEARYAGTDRKGEPTCASVKTLSAWRAV